MGIKIIFLFLGLIFSKSLLGFFRGTRPSTSGTFPLCRSFITWKSADSDDDSMEEFPKAKNISNLIESENKNLVNEILLQIQTAISPFQGKIAESSMNSTFQIDDGTSAEQLIKDRYESILASIRNSPLTDFEKSQLALEAKYMSENKESYANDLKQFQNISNISIDNLILSDLNERSTLYSSRYAPILVVHGSGPVGRKVVDMANSFSKVISFKYLDADQLTVIKDAELRYAINGVKSVIISADTELSTEAKKGWFGDTSDAKSALSSKGLKRLLVALNRESTGSDSRVKVTMMGLACKPPRSVGSFLTGDTTDIESEAILLSQQLGLGYSIVKVGKVIPDNAVFPTGVRDRRLYKPNAPNSGISKNYPFVILPLKSIVEASECTRVSVAAEGLFRASLVPEKNVTFSLLSLPDGDSLPRLEDQEWSDELLKLSGPELSRIPLIYSDSRRAMLLLSSYARDIMKTSFGLVTPIKVEKFQNGLRIIFKPSSSSYLSAKEEKEAEKAKEKEKLESSAASSPKRRTGYLSPEEEEELIKLANPRKSFSIRDDLVDSSSSSKKLRSEPLEGGLEIIVDTVPMPRVRVRRCNMGPSTIIKEESEALLLRNLLQRVSALESSSKAFFESY